MSRWTKFDGYIKTDNPQPVFNRYKLTETETKIPVKPVIRIDECGRYIREYPPYLYSIKHTREIQSDWFHGSEGPAELKLLEDNRIMISGSVRDCYKEEDFECFIDDFREIINLCNGKGYLTMDDGNDITQIEIYEEETITNFTRGNSKFYDFIHPNL